MNEQPGRPTQADGQRKHKKKSKVFQVVMRVLAGFLMLCIIVGCVVGCYLTLFVFDTLKTSESIELDLDLLKLNYTTIIYAQDHETGEFNELQRLEDDTGSRIWKNYNEMPPHLFDVLIAVEDKRFKQHTGVDWQRTILSFVNIVGKKFGFSLYEGTPGASTLTQQLVRNLTGDDDVDFSRKLREIFRALAMEREYSKDQIIESYLNTVPFGNNTHGIQAAANFYFNKDVSDLTVAECASIIGITKAPTTYNPYYKGTEKNGTPIDGLKNNQERKEDILFLMHQQGKLTDAQYKEASEQVIVFASENRDKRTSYKQSYFVDYLMDQVIADLAFEKSLTTAEASKLMYRGGYRIYATVDPKVQSDLEEVYLHPEKMPKINNKDEYPQSAFIITDTHGAIRGLVGGTGEKEGARIWNRATDTARQPGSTIKPISSYALSFENDYVTWSSLLLDGPYIKEIAGSKPWTPSDEYPVFKGYMILEEALQRSCNMVPIRMVERLTPKTLWTFLHDTLHVESLVESDIAPSPMSLGSLTHGVTPLELAGAYQMLANGGTYTTPYTYTKVLDSNGAVVLQRETVPTRVLSSETATLVNKMMQRVVTGPFGTGYNASLAKTNPGMQVAGKTGTTDDNVDQWFVGMTPYYIGVCWLGFDDQIKVTID
ncbi:MAG: transglycosylase domain-containing protein, partial [Angelakisella sp.]